MRDMIVSQSDLTIRKEAFKFRKDNGLGSKDPINVKSLLLKLKVLTVFRPIKTDFSGMAFKVGDVKCLLVNSEHTIGRQNFTILHELYHLEVQKDFDSSICYSEFSDKKNKADYNADLFASLTLLPEEGVLELIPERELIKNKILLGTIFELEQYFMCSRIALLYRLKNLDLIDNVKLQEYKDNVLSNARIYGYDTSLYEKGNKELIIGDYVKLAKILFDKEAISESHFMGLMYDIGIEIDSGISFQNDQSIQ